MPQLCLQNMNFCNLDFMDSIRWGHSMNWKWVNETDVLHCTVSAWVTTKFLFFSTKGRFLVFELNETVIKEWICYLFFLMFPQNPSEIRMKWPYSRSFAPPMNQITQKMDKKKQSYFQWSCFTSFYAKKSHKQTIQPKWKDISLARNCIPLHVKRDSVKT